MGNEGLTGRVLGGKFRLIRRIGTGGMGSVYQAVHLELEKKVAVKLLHQQMAPHQEVFQRFKREAKIACKLNHPHIIEVFDFDRTEDGIPYIIMEYLAGEDLEDLLQRRRRLRLDEVMAMFEGICSAVQQAHEEGVIHRDLKPQNILLCRVGDRPDFPKVLDFGISKLKDNDSIVTQTKAYLGTPCFMAPEQARGEASEATPQSDIFALGCILYRALGGRLAFSGDSIEAVLYKIIHEQPDNLDKITDQVPRAVCRVVHRAMAKDPQLRHPSVREMWRALVEAAGTEDDASAPAPRLQIIEQHPAEAQTVIPLSTTNRKVPRTPETRAYADRPAPPEAAPRDEGVPALDSMFRPSAETSARHQPGGVSTLSASMGEHLDKITRPNRSRRMYGGLALGLLLVAGAVVADRAMMRKEVASQDLGAEPTAVAGVPAPMPADPTPRPAPAPPTPDRVKIELLNVPAGAKVLLDGKEVTENPFSLERGEGKLQLQVLGREDQVFKYELTPDKDLTIAVALAAPNKPKPRVRPRPKPTYGRGTLPMPVAKPEPPKPEPPKVKEYGEGTMPMEL